MVGRGEGEKERVYLPVGIVYIILGLAFSLRMAGLKENGNHNCDFLLHVFMNVEGV